MKSVGSFNGITATSLLLIPEQKIKEILPIFNKQEDQYTLSALQEELKYLKYLTDQEDKKEAALITREVLPKEYLIDVMRGVFEFLRVRVNGKALGEDDDLFGGVDGRATNLFGSANEETSDDLFGVALEADTAVDILEEKSFYDYTVEELVSLGRLSVFMDESTAMDMLSEYQEIEKYINAFKLRLRISDKPVRESVRAGIISIPEKFINVWSMMSMALSNSTASVSLYDLSLDEMQYLINLVNTEVPLSIFRDPIHITDTVQYKGMIGLSDMVSDRILKTVRHKYKDYDRLLSMKTQNVGRSLARVLGVPVNRLHIMLRGKPLVDVAEALQNSVKSASFRAIPLVRSILSDLEYAEEYISSMQQGESNDSGMQEYFFSWAYLRYFLREGSKVEQSEAEREAAKAMSGVRLPEELEPDRKSGALDDFFLAVINSGLMDRVKEHVGGQIMPGTPAAARVGDTLCNMYRLYKLHEYMTLESFKEIYAEEIHNCLGEANFGYTEFLQLNKLLVTRYSILPFTSDKLYLVNIFKGQRVDFNETYETYKDVLESIDLLKWNFESVFNMLSSSLPETFVHLG